MNISNIQERKRNILQYVDYNFSRKNKLIELLKEKMLSAKTKIRVFLKSKVFSFIVGLTQLLMVIAVSNIMFCLAISHFYK